MGCPKCRTKVQCQVVLEQGIHMDFNPLEMDRIDVNEQN